MKYVSRAGRWTVTCLAFAATALFAGPPALDPPADSAVVEGRRLVSQMKAGERGPYLRLRWFCKDGTVLPPTPYACVEHGGGRQHAEYSADRQRLAELGWPAGTILAATPWPELWDADRRNLRLRQLLVERYLIEVDDGWVLRRARSYRGRVQVEDEETAGRELLVAMLAETRWVGENFLLARETVRSLPHHTGTDRTTKIRRLSQEIAEQEPSFEPIRVKIHTAPGAADVAATRGWIDRARERRVEPARIAAAEELVHELEILYGGDGGWLELASQRLRRHRQWPRLAELLVGVDARPPLERTVRLAAAMVAIRNVVCSSADGAGNLALLDLSLAVERELNRIAFSLLERQRMSREDLVELCRDLLTGAHGCGLLSERELGAAVQPLAAVADATAVELAAYGDAARALRRVPGWCLGTVRHSFAEAIAGYGALEPKAFLFSDDVLRGSAMLPLAEVITTIAADADELRGVSHRLFGERFGGLVALNPGMAHGRLRVVSRSELADGVSFARDEVVVLPQTVSELSPVAGILTLTEGNLLSHVQLLARNLGIPNASLSPALRQLLVEHDGQEVLYAVGSDGSVVVEAWSSLPDELRRVASPAAVTEAAVPAVDPPRPDLELARPIPLAQLSAGMAGSVVGPKAANLGELARVFPGRVEQAIALPFGIFAEHISRGDDPPKARLDRAFARHRAGELDAAGLAAEVEIVREQVTRIALSDALREQLEPMMAELFGAPGSYGMFIRSDTNVEDLPGFTGAGLNETLPNVVDPAEQRRGIARVWASPFRERAVAWRAPLLTRPEEVYTSVLLMKSVPADKSGVMVTADLVRRRPGLTVATSWGVGGAVDGDAAETVVVDPEGSLLLVGEAKAPFRRRLRPSGGVEWVPALAGRVLTDDEVGQLRQLAAEVGERLEPAVDPSGKSLPWDIEFGFVAGRLQLFQIRPLVERGSQLADSIAAALAPTTETAVQAVDLEAAVAIRSVPMEAITR